MVINTDQMLYPRLIGITNGTFSLDEITESVVSSPFHLRSATAADCSCSTVFLLFFLRSDHGLLILFISVHWSARLGQWEYTTQVAQKGQTSHPPNPGAPRRAICPGEGLPISYPILGGSGRGLPFTARIERAPFHRARSASKKDTWPLPPYSSQVARCASAGIVPATLPPFSASC